MKRLFLLCLLVLGGCAAKPVYQPYDPYPPQYSKPYGEMSYYIDDLVMRTPPQGAPEISDLEMPMPKGYSTINWDDQQTRENYTNALNYMDQHK